MSVFQAVNMPPSSPALRRPKPEAGTRIGNGQVSLGGVDGRSTAARRFREVVAQLAADLGGDPSQAQLAIIGRAATLLVWCEMQETRFALGEDFDIASFTTATNALRRLLFDLGLERRTRDVTPSLHDYLARNRDG